MQLAIVVGHNARAQGAVRRDTGETEFSWNSRLAALIEDAAVAYPGVYVKVFFRRDVGGYSREIADVYQRTDAWGADATAELHFNSAASELATGTETLTSGTKASLRFAEAVQDEMLDALGLRDRGEKYVPPTGRGGKSLHFGRAPAILVEPYFGSSPKGLAATDEAHEQKALAQVILRGFVLTFA